MYMLRAVIGDESRNDRQILKKVLEKISGLYILLHAAYKGNR